MTNYKEAVEYYAANRSDYLFHNKGPEHAKIILSNIFKNATSHIRIAANNLWNTEVVRTPEYVDSLRDFLYKSGSKLDILLTNEPDWNDVKAAQDENNIYKMLFYHPAFAQGRINIKTGKGKMFRKDGKPIHFCTADDSMYRLEEDIENRAAICNFKDPDRTIALEKQFDSVFQNLKSVEFASCLG